MITDDNIAPPFDDRSLFYHVPLKGVGTPYVQSMRSYVQGAAAMHNLRPTAFFRAIGRHDTESQFNKYTQYLLEQGDMHNSAAMALDLRDRLEEACCADLKPASMYRFVHLFNSQHLTRSVGRSNRYYCPHCVREGELPKSTPLLWEVSCVHACPIHKVKLALGPKCGAAKEDQLPISNRPDMSGVCSTCGSIGHLCFDGAIEQASNAEIWAATQIGNLLALSTEESESLTLSTMREGFRAVVRRKHSNNLVDASLKCGFARGTVSQWIRGRKPALGLVVQFCLVSQVDLVALLRGKAVDSAVPELGAEEAEQELGRVKRFNRSAYTDEELRVALKAAADEYPPPSAAEMCRRLKTHLSRLKAAAPEECKALVAAARAYRESQWEKAYEDHVKRWVEAGRALQAKGVQVTPRKLQGASGIHVYSRNPARVRALDEALRQLTIPVNEIQL